MKAILEMELPEGCEECCLCYFSFYEDTNKCAPTSCKVEDYEKQRHPDCPLKIIDDKEAENVH